MPAVEGLAADAEMAAGAGHVAATMVKIHPIQADSGLGNHSIVNLRGDTLSECH